MNMLDYLAWRGDISFAEKDLNEVDNLIFSTLVYLKMEKLSLPANSKALTIAQLRDLCVREKTDTSDMPCDPMKMLLAAADTVRFRDVEICLYKSLLDAQQHVQFAAVSYLYAPGKTYIAFRGTDNTLIGWRENCEFSYLTGTSGQKAAASYINEAAERIDGVFTVGGHSKGGNLAVYGSAFCKESIRSSRIVKIYSNDGPGFNSKIVDSPNYYSILDKLEKIFPESSVVGILLSSKAKRKVITSSVKGVQQHNPYYWNVMGPSFEEADSQSIASLLLDSTMSSWVASLSAKDKQSVIDTVFNALEASGAETLRDLKNRKSAVLAAFLKSAASMKPERRAEMLRVFSKLLAAGKETLLGGSFKELYDSRNRKKE